MNTNFDQTKPAKGFCERGTKTPLHNKRMEAAIASKGISADVIYKLTLGLMNRLQLEGDLLEYGAGTGSLIQQLLDASYRGKITGADIFARPALLPDEVLWIQGDLNNTLDVPDESFDTIISTEVIEHLENPRATFREFNRLLRPHGSIIITTPNQESFRSFCCLLFGGHFAAFLGNSYPAHITALLRKDFGRICLESGFRFPPSTTPIEVESRSCQVSIGNLLLSGYLTVVFSVIMSPSSPKR
jgi:2-polyprenyl-3-methyl-5-hydroxy-6-metoxy-1,4-benzoquinol methylase